MTKEEYTRLNRSLNAIAAQHKESSANSIRAEQRFAPIEKAITDLLVALKKRIDKK